MSAQQVLSESDNYLVESLVAAHDTTGLSMSLYLQAAQRIHEGFCVGVYVGGVIRCRVCGAVL